MKGYIEEVRNQFIHFMNKQGYEQIDIQSVFGISDKDFQMILKNKLHLSFVSSNEYEMLKRRLTDFKKRMRNSYKDRLQSTKNTYIGMKSRCLDNKCFQYQDYGGRGITICSEWLDKENGFKNFLSDMGVKPDITLSIDRINNNGNYEPSNCRWATTTEQAGNKRNSKTL